MSKFETTSYSKITNILKYNDFFAVTVSVEDNGISANSDGKKIVKAGTIVGGVSSPVLLNPNEPVQEKNTQSVAASLELDNATPDANSKVTITANEAGTAGNDIKVQFLDPLGNDQALAVSISGDTIVVSLATDGTGAITSTAAEVAAAINAHLIAGELVTAEASGDGSTVIEAHAATALANGAAGTGYLAEGVLLYDVDVTHGDQQGAMIVRGFIDENQLDSAPCDDAKEALSGRIVFCK